MEPAGRIYRYFLDMGEDKLFWRSVLVIFLSVVFLGMIVIYWGIKGFKEISIQRETLVLIAFAANGMLVVANVVTAHMLKRS